MSSCQTPWSTEAAAIDGGIVRVAVMLTTDSGPVREFRRFLDFDLDEAHATELLGKLAIALRDLRYQREWSAR